MTQAYLMMFALTAALGCGGSSSSPDAPGGGSSDSLTCQNGVGPESAACDDCGHQQCGSDADAVIGACADMVSCIEACQCDTSDTCLDGCIGSASTDCQSLITTYADCEKMSAVCGSDCTD